MIAVRRGVERGHFDHGWLDTYHTFSFSRYYDPEFMGFRSLRVINEDVVAPGRGFGMHGHENMEILTYVLDGQLAHRDSLGHTEILGAGEFQRMSAGTGIRHSEFNPSDDQPVHLYQIWIEPDREGHEPSYDQKRFEPARSLGRFAVVADAHGTDGALVIHQDAAVLHAVLRAGETTSHAISTERHAWVQVLRGEARVGDETLVAGDGAAISGESEVRITTDGDAELILFDLP